MDTLTQGQLQRDAQSDPEPQHLAPSPARQTLPSALTVLARGESFFTTGPAHRPFADSSSVPLSCWRVFNTPRATPRPSFRGGTCVTWSCSRSILGTEGRALFSATAFSRDTFHPRRAGKIRIEIRPLSFLLPFTKTEASTVLSLPRRKHNWEPCDGRGDTRCGRGLVPEQGREDASAPASPLGPQPLTAGLLLRAWAKAAESRHCSPWCFSPGWARCGGAGGASVDRGKNFPGGLRDWKGAGCHRDMPGPPPPSPHMEKLLRRETEALATQRAWCRGWGCPPSCVLLAVGVTLR